MTAARLAGGARLALPAWRLAARAAAAGAGAAAEALARRAGAEVVDVPGPGGEGTLRVCAGARRGAPCARGGTTWGGVFVTRRPLAALDPATVRHELVHVAQWRRWGALFPLLYLWAERRGPLRNRFEVAAGLRDGGYLR